MSFLGVYHEEDPRRLGSVDREVWSAAGPDHTIQVYWHDERMTLEFKRDLVEIPDSSTNTVPGVGPDAPIKTHPNGAKESEVGFAATSLPPKALLAVAATQLHGDQKYGIDNWRSISILDHLNHAQIHYLAHMAGDTQDKHLEHYATRALMALELHLEQNGGIK